MKAKKIFLSTFALLCVFGCGENTATQESEFKYKSQTYKMIEQNIHEMAKKSWDKEAYLNIRDKQITEHLEKKSEKKSALSLLEAEYSKLMVRDADSILQNGCPSGAKSHTLFKTLMKELKAYPDVPGLTDVAALEKLHDEADYFAKNCVGRQTVRSYRDEYNLQHETDNIAKAKKYLANPKLKCESVKGQLRRRTSSSGYSWRRMKFCQDIVAHYLETQNPALSELNAAKGRLRIYSNSDSLDLWKTQMEEHYNELNKTEDENE